MFHKVKEVSVVEKYVLQVVFIDGVVKKYDVEPLFSEIEAFQTLKEVQGLFELVRVDAGGYGICWNDDIDLACDELWENGIEIA